MRCVFFLAGGREKKIARRAEKCLSPFFMLAKPDRTEIAENLFLRPFTVSAALNSLQKTAFIGKKRICFEILCDRLCRRLF
jgi:hypothetical protein